MIGGKVFPGNTEYGTINNHCMKPGNRVSYKSKFNTLSKQVISKKEFFMEAAVTALLIYLSAATGSASSQGSQENPVETVQAVQDRLTQDETTTGAKDSLFEKFVHPPAEAKPFVRWWWGENAVTEDEIVREIDIMHRAGIGGFEINPISLPVAVECSSPSHRWLSPEFNRMMRVASDAARKCGMIADLIVGSGWPFGAEFIKPGNMTKRFYIKKIKVTGPAVYAEKVDEAIAPPNVRHKRAWEGALTPECLFVHLAPVKITNISQVRDMTDCITASGTVNVKVPAGEHTITFGATQEGFSQVVNGSPGAMGPVLDHYKAEALEQFLNTMAEKLGPAMGGKLGDAVRAVFCDSIELSAANWTADLPQQFRKRRGYDLLPYLSYVAGFSDPLTGTGRWNDTLKRVRYDYAQTLVELFHERFVTVYHDWCNEHGCLSRYQAYGSPWLMGMLEGYLIPDIPETNNWLFSHPDQHGFLVWSKYCSSGGHIAGRRIISTESMTNTRGVFQATLDQIKAADDLNFIMGINHSVLHGFTYSPREEGPYARVRYGAYFSDQNTWWPYFKKWAAYNARLSAVFQNTQPVVRLALLGPRAEIWSTYGLERGPFHNTPWYLPQLWKAFSHCGSSADHISEPVLQNALFETGKITCGQMTYEAVIVAGAETLTVKTAETLLACAEAGGTIVFIEPLPHRAPSLRDHRAADQTVQTMISRILKHKDNVVVVDAPEKETLLGWADQLLAGIGIRRDVEVKPLDPHFYQIRCRDGGRDLFFLVNTHDDRSLLLNAGFNTRGKSAWKWDPEAGTRDLFASTVDDALPITLPPHGSLLLVFEPEGSRVKQALLHERKAVQWRTIDGTWSCLFVPAQGKRFDRTKWKPADLGTLTEPELNTFAGTVTYRKTINLTDPDRADRLDLGAVADISEVTLNGKRLGCRWYGDHAYSISDAVKQGKNELEIKVTTVLYNYARTLPRTTCAGFWASMAKHKKTVAAGLIGPVKIGLRAKR